MRTATSYIAAFVLMTLAVLVTARPKSLQRIARMHRMIKEKTPMVLSKRSAASEEMQPEEMTDRVLAKLLGFDEDVNGERMKLDLFSELLDSPSSPRLGGEEPLHSDESPKEITKAKMRVRRRCPAGVYGCTLPTSSYQKLLIAAKETSQAKRRVRRRCPAGQYGCPLPTGSYQKSLIPADSSAEGADSQTADDKSTSGVLAKLLGIDDLDTGKPKQKPMNPFSSKLPTPSAVPKLSSKKPLSTEESTKTTKKPKIRRRRYCPAGQYGCHRPTSSKRS